MIWMTTEDLIDTVRRSLLENVAPAVEDPFARVQVIAAAHVMLELRQRLETGDPVVRDSAALNALLESWGEPRTASDPADPRAANRDARTAVSRAIAQQDDERASTMMAELARVEAAVAKEDMTWVCREAMATLE
ncbi:hypothetical protein [Streptomyces sp. NBC_01320]|uniref:hypothetical protein n=1 Tax=Streptomyces sp. NBC_01320 TaxID=2903824 RepID=UPI002E144C61|nr:hypothetical protein OG395_05205 [Streptomyces sp. NBC_01320]